MKAHAADAAVRRLDEDAGNTVQELDARPRICLRRFGKSPCVHKLDD
jgi:hypothetical protein